MSTWRVEAVSHLGDMVLLGRGDEACVVDLVTGECKHFPNGQSFVKNTAQAWIPYEERVVLDSSLDAAVGIVMREAIEIGRSVDTGRKGA